VICRDGRIVCLFVQEGRPLFAFFLIPSLRYFDSVESLIWLRVYGLCGLLFLGLVTYLWALKHHWRTEIAFVIALACVLTPGTAVFTFWAITWPFSWAMLIAFISGACAISAFQSGQGRRWLWAFSSVLLLVLAEGIYQPAAGAFVLPILIRALSVEAKIETAWRGWLLPIMLMVVSMIIYLALYKTAAHLFFPDSNRLARAKIDGDWLVRIREFFPVILKPALLHWFIFKGVDVWSPTLLALTALMSVPFIKAAFKQQWPQFLNLSALLASALVCISAPMLVSNPMYAPERTLGSLQGVVGVFVIYGGVQLFRGSLQRWGIPVMCILFSGVLAWACYSMIGSLVVRPSAAEYSEVLKYIRKMDTSPLGITFVVPDSHAVGPIRLDSYGFYASEKSWQRQPLVSLAMNEHFKRKRGDVPSQAFSARPYIDAIEPDQKAWYIPFPLMDLQNALNQRPLVHSKPPAVLEETVYQGIGKVQILERGWLRSDWFGDFHPEGGAWIFHRDVGWLILETGESAAEGIVNFQQYESGVRFMTSPALYPLCVNLITQTQIRFTNGNL
jgi:hypothetical protein